MHLNVMSITIGTIITITIMSILGGIQIGLIGGLVVAVAGAKWLRIQKQKAKDEIEYDERVNQNIKHAQMQTFSILNLLLLVYLLISKQILNASMINSSYLMIYISVTLIVSYYIVPIIVKKQ